MELFQFRLHHFRISEVQLIFMCCRFSRVISSSGYSACNRDYFSLAIIVMYNHTRVGLVEIKVRNKVFPLHKIRYGLAHNPEYITCNVTHPEHDWKAKEFVPSAKISAITPPSTPPHPPKKLTTSKSSSSVIGLPAHFVYRTSNWNIRYCVQIKVYINNNLMCGRPCIVIQCG